MSVRLPLLICLTLALLSACDTPPEGVTSRPDRDQLSHAEADARKARVSAVDYVLDIDLTGAGDAYQGKVIVQFDLTDTGAPLDIDFSGGSVTALEVNGQRLDPDYNGFFVELPAAALSTGRNTVTMRYAHPYDQDGTGLHRFVDPEDGNTYLYTYLWPYYANRLFPNFDQPNLKARYELTVRAPHNWLVVSAAQEDANVREGDTRVWHFPRTEPFSTYIFSLHAGPYHVWEDQAGDIPIRLLARESLSSYVDAGEWLTYTKAGLAHYRDYFGIAYPFGKYDQLIVPDFLIGAMENVGAVTFSESYVDRGPANRFNSQRRASTILHEMAHMWFGDLVTMEWWNGLWLNESFATLMSAIAVSEETEFDDLWHDFYLSENLTAIAADEAASTHPIEMPVQSTADFFTVFDSITYDKGASVLNQLSHFIGAEDFRLGVSSYLQQHAWDNTTLDNFIGALSAQSGLNLAPWAQDWLYQAGVNQLQARFSCEAGVVSTFAILQTATAEHPTLRDQRIQLGLLAVDDDSGQFMPYAALPVSIHGAETQVPAATGLPCPELALPNYAGWGYATVSLDEASMATLLAANGPGNIADPLLRSMFWTALFDGPDAGQMANERLLQMLIDSLAEEPNDRIIRQTLGELVSNLNRLERRGAAFAGQLSQYGPEAENRLWEVIAPGVTTAGQSTGTLNLRLSHYIGLARSSQALETLVDLLRGDLVIAGLELGQTMRWQIIRHLSARGHESAPQWLESEARRDPSDAGRRAAIAAEAARPDPGIKQFWVEQILKTDNPLPLSHLRAAMDSLFPTGQESLQAALLPQLTSNLGALANTRDNYFLEFYGRDLFAGICDAASLELVTAALADRQTIGATLYKFMSDNVQQAARCVEQRR